MLDLGQINGVIGLDSSPFDKVLDTTKTSLKKWSAEQANEAEKGGEETGKRFSSKFLKAAALVGTGALAVGGVFAAALTKGMNLEPATDKVAASLGLTEVEAEKAAKAAGKVYTDNWGESMEDAAQRTGVVISSITGMREASADEVARMTGLFSAFADTFELDITRATQVVNQMVSSGLAKNAEEGLDLLTASLQKVPVAVREDIMDAVDEYGPFMNSLGISGEAAMTLLVKASEKGMYGIDKTGDALKEFTIRATDMSKTSGDAYRALGLNQEKMTKDLLAGGERGSKAFAKIIGGLESMKDPAKQSQAALALFGTPLEDLNASEIPKFIGQLSKMNSGLGNVSGTTQRMGEQLGGNAQANLSSFMRTIEQGAVEYIGGKFLPALNDVTAKLNNDFGPFLAEAGRNLEGFGGWLRANEGWLRGAATAVGGLGAALGALGLVGYISSLGGLSGALTLLHGKIVASTVVTYAKQAALLVAAGASKAFAAAQWLVNAALSANPIGLVVLALAGLVAAFVLAYQNSEEFRAVVDGALQWVKGVAEAVAKWFMNDFLGFWNRTFEDAGKGVDDFGKGSKVVIDGVVSWFRDRGKDIGSWAKGVGDSFENARKWGTEKMNALKDGAGRAFDQLKSDFRPWSKAFGQLLSGDFNGFSKTAVTIMNNMKTSLMGVFNGIKDGAKRVWELLPADLKKPIQDAVRWINDTFVGGINGLLGKLSISFRVPSIPGFAGGGYTGPGGKYTPAGVVHAGEVVWSQDDVAAWGGPMAVDSMRRKRGGELHELMGFAGGGIVPNANQGFRNYNPDFLQRILAWAGATGRQWHMTGNGGARTFQDQLRAWNLYQSGQGPLAANPWRGGPHMVPGRAMDLSPRPGEYAGPRSMLGAFGLGLTVPGEPWHVGLLGGARGGGPMDFGIGDLVKGLLKNFPSIASPWGDIAKAILAKIPEGLVKAVTGSLGLSMGSRFADQGAREVAENGAELVLGRGVRRFGGGETVYNNRETRELLGAGAGVRNYYVTVLADDMRKAADAVEFLDSLAMHADTREEVMI